MDCRGPAAALAVLAGLSCAPASVHAQQPALEARERTIEIAVTYHLVVPIKVDDQAAQREALEVGRRTLYEMAAGECKVLEATIASACRLERLNLQSHVQRRPVAGGGEAAQLGASAAYRVALKPRP